MKLLLLTALVSFGLGYCTNMPKTEMWYSDESRAEFTELRERELRLAELRDQELYGVDYLSQLLAKNGGSYAR